MPSLTRTASEGCRLRDRGKAEKPRLVAKRSEKDSPLFSQTRFMLWLFQEMRTFAHYLFLKLFI